MRLKELAGPRVQDLALSVLGQGGSALLTLWYLRTAVRGFDPEAYGLAAAWLGLHQLLRCFLLLPLLQLLLYRFHEYQARGQGPAFKRTIFMGFALACGVFLLSAFLGLAAFPPTSHRWVLGGLLVGALGLAEGLRGLALNHFNLDERHGAYAATTLADAALRLVLLQAAYSLAGPHPSLLLVVPILATATGVAVLRKTWWPGHAPVTHSLPLSTLLATHRGFLLPIVLFGFTTWVTGLSDRYFLLQWTGSKTTGLYAALYGLFSTPFAILSASMIQVYRPKLTFHHAHSHGGTPYRKLQRHFLVTGIAASAGLALALWLSRGMLLGFMLRQEHAFLLPHLPLLLLAQVAFASGQLLEQGFYIRNLMSAVVVKQALGAVSALLLMGLLVPAMGVRGAFVACAGYYAIECLCGLVLHLRNPV